jgi:uncharacterized RDD family membrane protein YckC
MENRIGFGPRLGAYLLDFIMVGIITAIVVTVFGVSGAALGGAATAGSEDASAAALGMAGGFLGGIMASVIVVYVVALVWFLLEGFTGYTVGKLIVGIQIGNDDGTKAGVGKLLLRYAIKNISSVLGTLALLTGINALSTLGGILGLIIFIGFFFVLGARKQGFHDMIAKTAVYKRSELK